ncbi:MAG: response regulator [Candidatus Eisenbacteria bacterium]|uniref:Response regulator n=1 Tax=Eiseniibacteriota bacterium TaxID=2212470 RepID=A0A538TGT9_UNCEI|nr:MAG: response regulator [Candidatus Eisenbacteria bacterium]
MSAEPAAPRTVVLVIEDETPIRKFLRAGLEGQGYAMVEAATAEEGVTQAATCAPDVVLLDLGLPDVDGFEVVRRIRGWSTVPILVLSARGQDGDKVAALDAGADDYVTKPFSMQELLARLRVALRRRAEIGSERAESVVEVGRLRIDLARRRASVSGVETQLTPIEFRLLSILARHAGRVLTHDFLLREVWGPRYTTQHHYLRVYMAQLRHKVEENPGRPQLLLTETGVGYRMAEETRS